MEKKIALGGLLKRIGNYNIDTFDGRLILQKTIYLMQSFDLPLGYRFSWYIYGPYSPDLTEDGYQLKDIFKEVPSMKFVKEEREKQFKKFIKFLGEKKNDPKWLEILASIHFIYKLNRQMSKNDILKLIINKQPYILKKDCEEAWNYLEEVGLLN